MKLSLEARKGIGIAVAVWLTAALLLYGLSNLSAAAEQTTDERAAESMLAARGAMAAYKRDKGSYEGVTVARLRKLDAKVPEDLEEPVVFEDIYALTLVAPSGVTYRLGIGTGGRETRDCSVPPGTPPGECKLASPSSTTGSW